ncbi:MAG: SBBP repeat-containing protein, partial [Bacteroidia bacterium]|nr:SBBP repeat-containing protein [Bacteroidia bacterium]
MKQTLLIVICLVTLRSASQVQWIKTLGGSDTDLINDIATDNSGNVYMAGNFQDTIDFDPGPGTYTLWAGVAGSDAFLAKYNSAGALIWAKSFGDTIFFDQGERIAFDNSGHVYLTGYFRNHVDFDPGPGTTTLNSIFYSGTPSRDVFVSKFDTLGNFLWVRAVGGGTFDIARDVAVDQNGDVYVAGNFQWTADLDPTAGSYTATSSGKYDPFILKLSSSGTYLWARHFGGADQDQISAIDLDAAGNLYVVGTFEGTTDLDPGSGTFTVASNGNFDGFISKFNSSGNLIWAKRIGGANNDVIECIEIDSNCNLYLAGGFQNVVDFNMGSGTYTLNSQGTDVFINKIDSAGNFLWVKQLGNMNLSNARIWMFDRDAAGNIYTSGTFLNTVDLDPGPGTFTISTNLPGGQMFVCKHDVSGNFQWGAAYGRIISSTVTGGVPFGISADNLGNVYCGGWFKGDVDLDPSAATSTFTSPEGDMFFLKIGTNCLDAPSAPSVIYGPDHVCVGSTSHIYSVEPLPGAASYIWSLPSGWTGTSATNTILLNPSSSGVFSVAGSNACGTGSFSTYSININALPTLIVSSAQPMLCNAQTTTLTVNGASTYTWNDGTTANAIPIAPSITTVFTVTGTDVNGCVDSVTFTQQVYPLPTLSVSVSSPAICFGESATLQATGANNYTWTSFGTGASLSVSPLSTMVYTVNGTDANGCQNSATLGLIVNSLPVVSISSNDSVLCAGESSTLTAGGATSYTWSNNLTTTEITVTPAFTSTYSVTGIDINGCINSSAFTQSVSISNLSVSASDTVICVGETSTLSVNGAASYVWNPGGTGSAISVSPGANTVYTVTGTDLHGCINSATIGLDVNALPTLSVIASSTVICSGESATLSSVGAITYSWSSGGQGADITVSPSISSAYTVTGSDANACANSATLLLTVNALPTISATAQNATICAGGSATLTASGATTYSWSSGGVGMSAVVSPVSTFSYVVSGTDLNGCTNNATVAVNVNPLPTLNILPSATAICIGQSATLTATGASTYTWNPGGFGSSITVSPNQLTTYTVTGTDGNVCVNSVSFVLTVNTLPTVSLAPSHTAICLGESATLTAGGATAYSWSSGGSGISTVVSPGATTAYTVIGTDNNLCTNNATVEIIVNPLPAINILASNATLCIGQNATLTASGGSTYSWSPAGSAGSVVVSPITTSIYTVTGSDNNACSATATLQIV